MKHLTPPELIEAAEHSAPPARMTHVEACRACATAVAELRAALGDARLAADVPEPSPLFWDHFSARVKDATSGEPVPHPRWWAGVWRPVFAVAGLAAVPSLVARANRIRTTLGWQPRHDDLAKIVSTSLAWERKLAAGHWRP
jgi:hypothetical protein